MKLSRICVVGFPSKCGGADTELDHQIDVWQSLGIQVYLLPTSELSITQKKLGMENRNCTILEPRNWSLCKGMPTISYCNGTFLENLKEIKNYAKCTMWVNCMTWNFPLEVDGHRNGLIDLHLYQTGHGCTKVSMKLIETNSNFSAMVVKPYFRRSDFPLITDRPDETFDFGRISREDCDKFNNMQMWIYETMVAPKIKRGTILGINDRIRRKCGKEPDWIIGYRAGAISAQEFYRRAKCIILASDTFENLPRIGFEALSSGSLLIVDNRGGWRELVRHGETGFLCSDHKEFVYYSSKAAYEAHETKKLIENGVDWLDSNWGIEKAKQEWSKVFSMVEKLA